MNNSNKTICYEFMVTGLKDLATKSINNIKNNGPSGDDQVDNNPGAEEQFTTIDLGDNIEGTNDGFDVTTVTEYLEKGDYLYATLAALSAIPDLSELIGHGKADVVTYISNVFPDSSADAEVFADTVNKTELREAIVRFDSLHPGKVNVVIDHLSKLNSAVKAGSQRMLDALESWVSNTPVEKEKEAFNDTAQQDLSESTISYGKFFNT